MSQVDAVLFDAYGTLFDVHAPAAALTTKLGPVAGEISRLWRQKQLEYSWTLSLRGRYRSFWRLTTDALEYALLAQGLAGETQLREQLLAEYRRLAPYREVPGLLRHLRDSGLRLALLSNGDPDLLDDLVSHAELEGLLHAKISVAELGIYKPDQRIYRLGLDHVGVKDPGRCAFVSSNAWDAAGAAQAGLKVFWVNRNQQPIEYQLGQSAKILADLSELGQYLLK